MRYMIAPGKSFTTLKAGVVTEYQEVTPKKIGSASLFADLVKSGAIVELSSKPEVVNSINLRPQRYKHVDTGDRKLDTPAVAEVKKVEVIEPIKKKVIIPEPIIEKKDESPLTMDDVESLISDITEEPEEQTSKRKYERKKNLFDSESEDN